MKERPTSINAEISASLSEGKRRRKKKEEGWHVRKICENPNRAGPVGHLSINK